MKHLRLRTATALLVAAGFTAGPLSADLDPNDLAKAAKVLREIQELSGYINAVAPTAEITVPTPRQDTDGQYISPYRSDGTLAEWARKAVGGAAGAALGNLAGDQLGKAATKELAAKVPGGALIGGLFGKKAKKALAETAAVKAIGGWDYIKETSDLSFDNTMDLAVYLHANYASADPDYAQALAAAMGVYPRLQGAYEPAIKRAYGREVVMKAQDAKKQGILPKLPELPGSINSLVAAGGGTAEEQAVQGAFLATAVDANTMDANGGTGGSAAELGAQQVSEPAPDVPDIAIDAKKSFGGKVKQLSRSQRVIVAGFRVGFIVRDSVTASVAAGYQFGGTHTSGARSKTAVELAGVDNSTLQHIADALYDDFLAELTATGREVVTVEELKATSRWKDLDVTPASVAAPYVKEAKWLQDRILTVYTPSALPLWWTQGEQMGDKSPFALNNWKVMTAISHELDAVVVVPTYLLSFAELESSGNKRGLFAGYGSGRASTAAKPNMVLQANENRLYVLHAKNTVAGDVGQVTLKKNVVVGDFGAEMITLDERDNNNASRAALLGLAQASGNQGIFAAAGASKSEQTLAVQTNPEWFSAFSLAALRGVNDAFISLVKANPAR